MSVSAWFFIPCHLHNVNSRKISITQQDCLNPNWGYAVYLRSFGRMKSRNLAILQLLVKKHTSPAWAMQYPCDVGTHFKTKIMNRFFFFFFFFSMCCLRFVKAFPSLQSWAVGCYQVFLVLLVHSMELDHPSLGYISTSLSFVEFIISFYIVTSS